MKISHRWSPDLNSNTVEFLIEVELADVSELLTRLFGNTPLSAPVTSETLGGIPLHHFTSAQLVTMLDAIGREQTRRRTTPNRVEVETR